MASNERTIGNFELYSVNNLRIFLQEKYGIKAEKISLFANAMDNTVLDVDNKYILKIYETKSTQKIISSVSLYQKFQKYYCIDLCKTVNGQFVVNYIDKPAICYKKKKGRFSKSLRNVLVLLKEFHEVAQNRTEKLNVKNETENITKQILFYLPRQLKTILIKRKRYHRYKTILQHLKKIDIDKSINTTYGIIHGDCSPNNILVYQGKYQFIDFDDIQYNYQIYDIVRFLLKYDDNPIISTEKRKLRTYYSHNKKIGDFNNTYDIINLLCCYKGLEMMLSTEYFCFVVNKFSEDVLNKYFLATIDRLYKNVEIRLTELKNERSNSNT